MFVCNYNVTMKKEKPHYLGHRKRLKERFVNNPSSLADYEIVELLLGYVVRGKDVKPQAKNILAHVGGIQNIFKISDDIEGVGSETVLFFNIIKDLFRRCEYSNLRENETILNSPTAVFKFLKFEVGFDDVEKLIAVFLDSKGRIKEYKVLSSGSVNESYFPPKELAKQALVRDAVAVILAHNHPSGNLKPSQSDIRYTKNVKNALELVDIALVDHIIVTKNGFLSFKQEELL
ncbi:DNA repair protein RadC [Deferribacter desulfuricans SSM1]|uniref:DNA repair protein RadC n=2 Tax=Deferribacter TaxID=53572 RepID=D3PBS2_DEFDS|nr:DNA repair protein RadC [Deferribacter desulfuricans SSM1]